MASIKAFDPVSVPLSVLEEVQQLRALVEQLRVLARLLRKYTLSRLTNLSRG